MGIAWSYNATPLRDGTTLAVGNSDSVTCTQLGADEDLRNVCVELTNGATAPDKPAQIICEVSNDGSTWCPLRTAQGPSTNAGTGSAQFSTNAFQHMRIIVSLTQATSGDSITVTIIEGKKTISAA